LGIIFSTSVARWAKRFFLAAWKSLAWFQLSATYGSRVWLLFIYDMRLIHARVAEARNDADRALYGRPERPIVQYLCAGSFTFFPQLACALAIWNLA